MTSAADDIRFQIIWSRLIAAVEEQAHSLIRAGFSTSTREAGDVSAGIFSKDGDMVAQAVTGTPGHINSMARSVRHFLDVHPLETMKEGDAFITNDPWKGTGHLSDLTIVSPVHRNGVAIALFACTTHVVDIGGNGPSPESRQVHGEGLFIPIMHIMREGTMNEDLLKIIRANVREPVQVEGDVFALVSCNEVGGRRVQQMLDEYGLADLDAINARILENSRKAMVEAIEKLPKGTFKNSLRIDGYENAIDLVATLTIGNGEILVDLTGSSPASGFGINCPLCYTDAYTSFGVKCVVAPTLPNNAATLSCIQVSAPEGTIVNAQYPSAVVARSTIGMFLPDLVFGCFEQAMPDTVPAESTGALWNVRLASTGGSKQKFMANTFHSGGAGARPAIDGLAATPFPSGVRNVPVEITEAITSLIVWKKEFREDSGGAGRQRGGLGQTMIIGNREDEPLTFFARYERVEHPARGRQGGDEGASGEVKLRSGATLKPKGVQTVPAGDAVVLEMPGGGGYGKAIDRDPALVAEDVRLGFISHNAARQQYGVEVSADLSVDEAKTAALRGA